MKREARRISLRRAGWPLALAFAFFYIGFHAVSGERGVYAWFKESRRLEALKAELASAVAQRQGYERKIARLSDRSLDLDLLEEQARAVLGFAAPDEIVVLMPERVPH